MNDYVHLNTEYTQLSRVYIYIYIYIYTSIGTRSAVFFNESRTKVPKLYGKESMSSGTF